VYNIHFLNKKIFFQRINKEKKEKNKPDTKGTDRQEKMGNRISKGTCTINGKSYNIALKKSSNIANITSLNALNHSIPFYKGEFKEETFHGHGTVFWDDGHKKYTGEWDHGEIHGSGIAYDENGCVKYRGQFGGAHHEDGIHGFIKGKLYYDNEKIKYDGSFFNGKRTGQGTFYSREGYKIYEGEWDNDNRHGQGTLYGDYGVTIYEGLWENDIPMTDDNIEVYNIESFNITPPEHYNVTLIDFSN